MKLEPNYLTRWGYETPDYLSSLGDLVDHPLVCGPMQGPELTAGGRGIPVFFIGKACEELNTVPGTELIRREEGNEKPVLLVDALHHAREIATPYVLHDFLKYFLECETRLCEYIKGEVDIVAVPVLNIDGLHAINDNGDRGTRKNMRETCVEGYSIKNGVDLNRNYSFHFENEVNECDPVEYAGDAAFSEPESRLIKFLTGFYPVVSAINLHSYGSFWAIPFNCCGDLDLTPLQSKIYASLKQSLVGLEDMNSAPKAPALQYEAKGSASDYMLATRGIIAVSPEVGNEKDGFWPTRERIHEIGLTSYNNLFQVLKRTSGVNLELIFEDDEWKITNNSFYRDCEPHKNQDTENFGLEIEDMYPAGYCTEFSTTGLLGCKEPDCLEKPLILDSTSQIPIDVGPDGDVIVTIGSRLYKANIKDEEQGAITLLPTVNITFLQDIPIGGVQVENPKSLVESNSGFALSGVLMFSMLAASLTYFRRNIWDMFQRGVFSLKSDSNDSDRIAV